MIATIIDSLIVVLLIGSIGYGYVVSMKLRKLTATLKQLEPLVEQFSSAVDKSEQSVHHMRESIETAQRTPAPVEAPPPARRNSRLFRQPPRDQASVGRTQRRACGTG